MTTATPGELLALADKIAAFTPSSKGPIVLIARERRMIEDALRLAAKPADEDAKEESAYAAYLGICVLATMCKKAGLSLAEKRATELLIEMGNAFPSFAGRSALRALSTTGTPKS